MFGTWADLYRFVAAKQTAGGAGRERNGGAAEHGGTFSVGVAGAGNILEIHQGSTVGRADCHRTYTSQARHRNGMNRLWIIKRIPQLRVAVLSCTSSRLVGYAWARAHWFCGLVSSNRAAAHSF